MGGYAAPPAIPGFQAGPTFGPGFSKDGTRSTTAATAAPPTGGEFAALFASSKKSFEENTGLKMTPAEEKKLEEKLRKKYPGVARSACWKWSLGCTVAQRNPASSHSSRVPPLTIARAAVVHSPRTSKVRSWRFSRLLPRPLGPRGLVSGLFYAHRRPASAGSDPQRQLMALPPACGIVVHSAPLNLQATK